ncbi:MAG TPA: hypothetical protein VKX45_20315 [Bryobacteraceae bacterium]|jgi:hypothetical protein|nr:hypothetical protein [Bryobacteraceae bacterium]
MKWWWRAVPLALLAAVLTWPCGPFFPEFEYAPVHGPVHSAVDVDRFDRGEIGVIRPGFFREPLVIAYRYLAGVPLTDAERAAVALRQPVRDTRPVEQWTATGRWLSARNQVAGAAPVPGINPYRRVPGGQWEFFPNCLDTAFDTAVATLQDRIAKWGVASPNVAEWLRGQDQVFENCSGGPSIPVSVSGSDTLLAADRQYQIAAAEFYAGKYADAERDFDAIAANAASPWRDGGHYLAARALIRDGTVNGKPESLKQAEAKLQAVISDPAAARWHDSARGLIEFIRGTLDPEQRMIELGNELTRPGGDFRKAVTDYTHLWDLQQQKRREVPAAASEITDWIATFQHGNAPHAIERWQASKSMPWLVAALTAANATDPAVPGLLAAARQIAPDSPAYATAAYYGIRLQIFRGETDAAREWADRALATKQLDSTVNLLRAERLRLARNWDEFLRFGPRKPVGVSIELLGSDDSLEGQPALLKQTAALDTDFTRPMNTEVPLRLWMSAANSNGLPREFQAQIAEAGWVRAVLLDDRTAARALARRAAELSPALAPAMRDYLAQSDPRAAGFTAAFWMLRMPGLIPELRAGVPRHEAPDKIDDFRDNWWLLGRPPALGELYESGQNGPPDFLPAGDRAEGEKQSASLQQTAGNGVNYLCAAAIAWARAHPQDLRVPEALHLAVRATRYGLGADKESSRYSKEAFDLLHRRYPNSPWTKQTKYWY